MECHRLMYCNITRSAVKWSWQTISACHYCKLLSSVDIVPDDNIWLTMKGLNLVHFSEVELCLSFHCDETGSSAGHPKRSCTSWIRESKFWRVSVSCPYVEEQEGSVLPDVTVTCPRFAPVLRLFGKGWPSLSFSSQTFSVQVSDPVADSNSIFLNIRN